MTSIIRWASNSLSRSLELNSATLSGAIDVIVVEQPNGELFSSPFHVRFGKLQLHKTKGEIVHIRVNGVEVPLKMRLGSAGEAFFVERSQQEGGSVPDPDRARVFSDESQRLDASDGASSLERKVEAGNSAGETESVNETVVEGEQPAPGSDKEEQAEMEEVAKSERDGDADRTEEASKQGSGSEKRSDLSAVLPKWYTSRIAVEDDEEENDYEMLRAALEWREQQQARKLERVANSSDNLSAKTDDDQSSLSGAEDLSAGQSASAPEEDDDGRQRDEEAVRSWIWSYGSLPRRLHSVISSKPVRTAAAVTKDVEPVDSPCDDETATREVIKQVLAELVARATDDCGARELAHTAAETMPAPSKDQDARAVTNFVRMLWSRRQRTQPNSKADQVDTTEPARAMPELEQSKAEEAVNVQPKASDESRAEDVLLVVGRDVAAEGQLDNTPTTALEHCRDESAAASPKDDSLLLEDPHDFELVLRGVDGDVDVVSEAQFRSNGRCILADPRLSVRVGGVHFALSEALPALVMRAVFGSDATLTALTTTRAASEPYIESGNGASASRALEGASIESVPATCDAERAKQPSFGSATFRNLLFSTLPSERQSNLAAVVAAAAEDDQIELGSSDNLAALVALDQINPEFSSGGNLAALIQNKSEIQAAFNDIRRMTETNLVGLPLEASGSFHSLCDAADVVTTANDHGSESTVGPILEAVALPCDEPLDAPVPVANVESNEEIGSAEHTQGAPLPKLREAVATMPPQRLVEKKRSFPYRKTLRPSARQIASLSLKRGANLVEFYVRGPKGNLVVSSTVYRWSRYAKCVFAEIDGVVASGGVAPLQLLLRRLGSNSNRQQHGGVADLCTKIARNGYCIVYVTTRAVGVASSSREALEQLWEGEVGLPRAPVLVAPSSLLDSAYRSTDFDEHRFKTAALSNIIALFPGRNPLWAALARRQDDVSSYLNAGVPRGRVFRVFRDDDPGRPTVLGGFDRTGAVVSSYERLNSLVDQTFPPFQEGAETRHRVLKPGANRYLDSLKDARDDRYSDLNFWKLAPACGPPRPPLIGTMATAPAAAAQKPAPTPPISGIPADAQSTLPKATQDATR